MSIQAAEVLPYNCKNYLALGAVIYGDMTSDQALRIIGLKKWKRKAKNQDNKA